MEIMGALKKSNSPSTVYFCEYRAVDFDRRDVVALLGRCRLSFNANKNLNDDDIHCIAVESNDDLQGDRNLVGIAFRSGECVVCLTPQEHSDLEVYLREIAGDKCIEASQTT